MLSLVDGRRDGLGLQLRLWLTTIARPAQPMTAKAFGNRAFDACPQGRARLARLKWIVLLGGARAPRGWARAKGGKVWPWCFSHLLKGALIRVRWGPSKK